MFETLICIDLLQLRKTLNITIGGYVVILGKNIYLTNLPLESTEYMTLVGAAYSRGKLTPVHKKDH